MWLILYGRIDANFRMYYMNKPVSFQSLPDEGEKQLIVCKLK